MLIKNSISGFCFRIPPQHYKSIISLTLGADIVIDLQLCWKVRGRYGQLDGLRECEAAPPGVRRAVRTLHRRLQHQHQRLGRQLRLQGTDTII